MSMLSTLINSVNDSISQHETFRKQVADMIRNKEMKPAQKIDEISNILM